VPRPAFPRSIVEFQRQFADEEACRQYLFASRWPDGFSCQRCDGSEIGVMHRRLLWQCKGCGLRTSVTAGTVMHKTRTPRSLVLGRVLGRDAHARDLGRAAAAPARHLAL
jgi:hypothetical protein